MSVELLFVYSCFLKKKRRGREGSGWSRSECGWGCSECKSSKYHWLSIRLAWGTGECLTHRSGVKCSQQHAASIIGMFSKLKSLRQKKYYQTSHSQGKTGDTFPGCDKKKRRGTEGHYCSEALTSHNMFTISCDS